MIYIENGQEKVSYDKDIEDLLRKIIDFSLKEEEVLCETEINIVLVDNEEIRDINREHRKIDRVTDVLSFPMLVYPEGRVYKEVYDEEGFDSSLLDDNILVLGDMVISLERAMEQSIEFEHSFKRELCYLTVHSILHLLGYDHIREEDKDRMRKREEYILSRFNINRN